jgi:glycosyltransferase involved in cell wall biosynthesis
VTKPSVAVAVPAYNEADGIAGFLGEIDRALISHVSSLRMIVVDDASTDSTRRVLDSLRSVPALPSGVAIRIARCEAMKLAFFASSSRRCPRTA